MTTIAAFPMHGEIKLRREGLRTRDAHLLEWIAELTGARVLVLSRPEPFPRRTVSRSVARIRPAEAMPEHFTFVSREILRVPDLRGARRWWTTSLDKQPMPEEPVHFSLAWNPMAASKYLTAAPSTRRAPLAFDMLDDWTSHPAFEQILPEVTVAYQSIFELAEVVSCNSEATLERATSMGRTDAHLILNGCDYERFHAPSLVGYGGKIGFRLDTELIGAVTSKLPETVFEFAGPVLDKDVGRLLRRIPNVRMLGDVPYSEYPRVVRSWTAGWVPHRTGAGEVGGDVIKVYEYVAAGLPTFVTPILGGGRGLDGVSVASSADEMAEGLGEALHLAKLNEPTLPSHMTWRYKATTLLDLLGWTA